MTIEIRQIHGNFNKELAFFSMNKRISRGLSDHVGMMIKSLIVPKPMNFWTQLFQGFAVWCGISMRRLMILMFPARLIERFTCKDRTMEEILENKWCLASMGNCLGCFPLAKMTWMFSLVWSRLMLLKKNIWQDMALKFIPCYPVPPKWDQFIERLIFIVFFCDFSPFFVPGSPTAKCKKKTAEVRVFPRFRNVPCEQWKNPLVV